MLSSNPAPGNEIPTATIVLDEYSRHGRAMVRLRWQEASLVGRGLSRLDATDEPEHTIGQKLALARALSHLARQLFTEAASDIEGASAARSA
ncbi:hypothetical protein TUM20985_41630 [Mycobacterium antarcticum]|uniref:dsRBD fold-containing protein n=1 Tax=Mycolicibacterium sp. TUM20985 TaxID=3023370 RepID=UPI0025727E0F|nr:dsRBD fold-containing protein [Mycolicibacterium sp. TUM20985]BDX33616.1 hypothetical protein TUM20985_41630 [Mycolicibacterium sp. TUM20985]